MSAPFEPPLHVQEPVAPAMPTPVIAPAVPLRRRRRRLVAALKLSAVTIGLLVLIAGFGLLLWVRRGDVQAARRTAAGEMRYLLEPGERIEREAFVSQRHWYHYFREMHGILAATDRRLLYVGVEPAPLLPRREFEPQTFEEKAYAWDTTTTIRRQRVHFGTSRGVVIRAREGVQAFAFSGPQQERVTAVAAWAEERRVALARALARERQARIAAEIEARKPKYHTVERGEAIFSIAERYNVTPEQLRAWNNLTSDRIRAGQTLMVKPQT